MKREEVCIIIHVNNYSVERPLATTGFESSSQFLVPAGGYRRLWHSCHTLAYGM
jgi:hypothetical protein